MAAEEPTSAAAAAWGLGLYLGRATRASPQPLARRGGGHLVPPEPRPQPGPFGVRGGPHSERPPAQLLGAAFASAPGGLGESSGPPRSSSWRMPGMEGWPPWGRKSRIPGARSRGPSCCPWGLYLLQWRAWRWGKRGGGLRAGRPGGGASRGRGGPPMGQTRAARGRGRGTGVGPPRPPCAAMCSATRVGGVTCPPGRARVNAVSGPFVSGPGRRAVVVSMVGIRSLVGLPFVTRSRS